MKWLFQDLDGKAFGVFRFVFYMTILYFYKEFQPLYPDTWLTPDLVQYFEPISFFKFFNYDNFLFLKTFNIFEFWKWCMLFSAIGFLFPLSSILSFIVILILAGVGLNFGKIHHLNHMPVVILGILAFSFKPGRYSVDNFILACFGKKTSPVLTTWFFKTAQIYMCLVYFASGIQKLRFTGLDWVFSDNMQNIILTRPTVTSLGLWIAQFPILCTGMALITVLADLSAPLAIFSKRARILIIPTLFMFHLGTFAVLGLHGYFIPYNLCFLVWLPWEKITVLSEHLLVKAAHVFESYPASGRGVQVIYTRLFFPLLKLYLKLKFGKDVELFLRHSILTKNFNPLVSDIDYTVVIKNDFKELDRLIQTISKLSIIKIFDTPQIYLVEEWEKLRSFEVESQKRIQFFWNYRKLGWLSSEKPLGPYEFFKKKRALKISEEIISNQIRNWTFKNFPQFNPDLPAVCIYSNYLELTAAERCVECDVNQLMFILSHLPGELHWVELDLESINFKKDFWTFEYLLSRSHLRTHYQDEKDVYRYREFLRDLEENYLVLFGHSIVASGEEFDLV